MTGIGLTSLHLNATFFASYVAHSRVPATESRDIVKPLPSGPNVSSHKSGLGYSVDLLVCIIIKLRGAPQSVQVSAPTI